MVSENCKQNPNTGYRNNLPCAEMEKWWKFTELTAMGLQLSLFVFLLLFVFVVCFLTCLLLGECHFDKSFLFCFAFFLLTSITINDTPKKNRKAVILSAYAVRLYILNVLLWKSGFWNKPLCLCTLDVSHLHLFCLQISAVTSKANLFNSLPKNLWNPCNKFYMQACFYKLWIIPAHTVTNESRGLHRSNENQQKIHSQ